jgi:hypothetical protein
VRERERESVYEIESVCMRERELMKETVRERL